MKKKRGQAKGARGVGGRLEQCQHLHFPQLELTRIYRTKQQSKALRDEGGLLSESTFQHGLLSFKCGRQRGMEGGGSIRVHALDRLLTP